MYTPGDNEWTDCHRENNGRYNPLERLAKDRQVLFPRPDKTLGQHSVHVQSQADEGFVKNVSYSRANVGFAAVHVVGSNNSLDPWTGLGQAAPTPEQLAEVQARTNADLDLINDTFDKAVRSQQKAVVLLMQADMFDPTVPDPKLANTCSTATVTSLTRINR